MTVSRDEVFWAYRILLGREPESDAVVTAALDIPDVATLRRNFLACAEYRQAHQRRPSVATVKQDRGDLIRTYIAKEQVGIEIGAWFNPLVPRSAGYNSLSLDVFGTEELIRRAEIDPNISAAEVARIQDVDFVGSAVELEALVDARGLTGSIDYIVSAHNFEHLPDAISFFRACSRVLRSGGFLSMAIPDRRACFDYFRPDSTTGHMLDAFWQKRDRPSPGTIFDHFADFAENRVDAVRRSSWWIHEPVEQVALANDIAAAYGIAEAQVTSSQPDYIDAHCWTMTPASFEAIITDLQYLGLVPMTLREVVCPGTHEFHVHLQNVPPDVRDVPPEAIRQRRTEALMRVTDAATVNSRLAGSA